MADLRVTSQAIIGNDTGVQDAVLSPDDPIHALKGAGVLGTLRPEQVNAAYSNHRIQTQADAHFTLRNEAQRLGIRPGSPAWHELAKSMK